ncbi:MAG: hypothetical protein C0467_17140 [Planctomycetaceae bacterium]|nr:hypothetical protein [Planctomycetaceae bacterium]
MTRRPGLTLTEVLVTLGILAFGILAILTLFPLAASQMAVAVREDRSAQAANAADGYMRAYWKKEFVEKNGTTETAIMSAFDDPDGAGALPAAAAGETSYPVLIDPMGFAARPSATQIWAGDGGASKLARRTLSALNGNSQYSFRACSLMDGMGYDDNGHPTPDREMRYNWAWLLQRPVNGGADNNTATMDVLVYDNRPNLYAPTGMEGTFDTAAPYVVPGTTTLNLVKTAGVLPNVKPGMWIMDVTDPTVNPTPPNKIRHAYCYQVTTVTPDATGNVVYLELQTPLKKANDPTWTAGTYAGRFVVLRGVAGVYSRTPLTGN